MSRSLSLLCLITALVSQSLASATFDDQKTYYGHHHHHNPPSTPSTPTPTPSPSHGGSGGSTPSTPKECPTPSTPSKSPPSSGHGGGGYYPSPTPSTPTPSVPTPSVPTPSVPTPSVPTPYVPTPTTPSTPPFIPDPNSPPFTCTYWRNHPQLIWGVLGWWGTLGNAFGAPNIPGIGTNVSLKDALSNTRTDGYGELCRQATAALLNSMVDHRFAFSTKQVRDSFVSALASDKTASVQANLFRLANEAKH